MSQFAPTALLTTIYNTNILSIYTCPGLPAQLYSPPYITPTSSPYTHVPVYPHSSTYHHI